VPINKRSPINNRRKFDAQNELTQEQQTVAQGKLPPLKGAPKTMPQQQIAIDVGTDGLSRDESQNSLGFQNQEISHPLQETQT
jgi:hypothetical protein